jgi:hypothetical protein
MHRSLPYLSEDVPSDLTDAGRCVLAWVRSAICYGFGDMATSSLEICRSRGRMLAFVANGSCASVTDRYAAITGLTSMYMR